MHIARLYWLGQPLCVPSPILIRLAGGNSVNLEHLTVTTGIYVFIAGAVAICAMVLPGISGSTLLLIMGLYLPIVTAIKDILHLNLKSFPTVFVFGCGVLVGIFSIVKLIRKALERFRAQMIFLIVGLMLGSIYAVIMGPTTLDTPQPAMTIHQFFHPVLYHRWGSDLWFAADEKN